MFNVPNSQRTSCRYLINSFKKNKISCKLRNFSVLALSSAFEDNVIHLSIFKFNIYLRCLKTGFPLCFCKFAVSLLYTKQFICIFYPPLIINSTDSIASHFTMKRFFFQKTKLVVLPYLRPFWQYLIHKLI